MMTARPNQTVNQTASAQNQIHVNPGYPYFSTNKILCGANRDVRTRINILKRTTTNPLYLQWALSHEKAKNREADKQDQFEKYGMIPKVKTKNVPGGKGIPSDLYPTISGSSYKRSDDLQNTFNPRHIRPTISDVTDQRDLKAHNQSYISPMTYDQSLYGSVDDSYRPAKQRKMFDNAIAQTKKQQLYMAQDDDDDDDNDDDDDDDDWY